jgi:hypothetical protein
LEREDIFKPAFGNESPHQDSNDNDVRIINFASKNTFKSLVFPRQNIHKYFWPLLVGRLTAGLSLID